MNKYKFSMYSITIKSDKINGFLVANSKYNSLCYLSESEYEKTVNAHNYSENEIPEKAIKHHLVVEQDLDEVTELLKRAYLYNHDVNTETLYFVIAPTMACNYKCVYCFEHNRDLLCSDYMSEATIQDIINFIKRCSKAFKKTKKISIKWFGGEPLLRIDVIEKIANGIRHDFANEDGIELYQFIITNGRLLTREIAERLANIGIKRAQITIDGMPETYAKMKGCKESDFYTVVENIKNTQDLINISVRVNVADYNKDEVKQLADYLDEQGIKTGFYTAWVQQYTKEATDTTSVNADDYNKIYHDTTCYINDEKKNLYSNVGFPKMSPGCEACRENHWCITPDGSLYCCEHLLGNEKYKIGSVTEGIYKESQRDIWQKPFIPQKCLSCNLLPRCLINCITDRDIEHIPTNCDFLKENYKQNILLYMKYKKSSQSN